MDTKQAVKILREEALQNGEEHADTKLLAIAQLLEYGTVDHVRLVRVEKMLEFMLSRQVVESQRRPSIDETKALEAAGLPVPAQLIVKRTLLDEFDITYAEYFQQFMKPAAPAAEGAGHAQEA